MRKFYKAGALTLGLAAGGVLIWARRDYLEWLALGPGGLPANLRGWLTTTRMRLRKIDPIDTARYSIHFGGPSDRRYLGPLPPREGARPTVGVHPVPHRQLNQFVTPSMHAGITHLFDAAVERRRDQVHYQLSFFERRHSAIFVRSLDECHPHAISSHGEIAHVHPSDGSMHMIFSHTDAKAVIDARWGEMHPLAGQMLGLPATYLLIYPPRDADELAVTEQLLNAAIAHMTCGFSANVKLQCAEVSRPDTMPLSLKPQSAAAEPLPYRD